MEASRIRERGLSPQGRSNHVSVPRDNGGLTGIPGFTTSPVPRRGQPLAYSLASAVRIRRFAPRSFSIALVLAAMGAGGCGGIESEGLPGERNTVELAPDIPITITYRQFSTAPSLSRGDGSPNPASEDYGALSVFIRKAEARTDALGPGMKVTFLLSSGPANFADVAIHAYDAAYMAGGSLNGTWGFVYNSIPFGPEFLRMIDFLHGGVGISLVNQILVDRDVDVIAFPVVGSPAQMSGYFKKPVGIPDCPEWGDDECGIEAHGIGLEGLCGEAWTLRYLPPAESVVDEACNQLGGDRRLGFVQAIPGGAAFLPAIQQGAIDGLEFATPIDDFDAAKGGFFGNASVPEGSDGRNLGEIGLRYAHYPAWHQPFYLGWMVFNRSQVWEALTNTQRTAIEEAAREAVVESFAASSVVQCDYLRRILAINDGKSQRRADGSENAGASADMILTKWTDTDLGLLREATRRILERSVGGAQPTVDETDLRLVIGALQRHLGYESIAEMLAAWSEPDFPIPGGCVE